MAGRPARLFLVRHGVVAANRRMALIGRRDDPLTALGRRQAEQVGRALGALAIDRVLTSPLQRARDTAVPIGRAAGRGLESEDRLLEQAFGAWEGLTAKEIAARGEADRRRLERWRRDLVTRPPGGESLQAVQARMEELAAEIAADGGQVVLVSHVGPIKALLCTVLGLPLAANRRLFLDSATVTVIDWADPPVLRLFNAHCHLGWTRARWMDD